MTVDRDLLFTMREDGPDGPAWSVLELADILTLTEAQVVPALARLLEDGAVVEAGGGFRAASGKVR